MQKISLNIEGMHCGACATGIQMLVSNLEGVKSVSVDYTGKKGNVEFDDSKIKLEEILSAVKDLGYTATQAA